MYIYTHIYVCVCVCIYTHVCVCVLKVILDRDRGTREEKRERETHFFPLHSGFSFMSSDWRSLANLAYGDDSLTNYTSWPGPNQ